MTVEPSDIAKLLAELGRDDPTCHALHAYLQRGENILTVCHEAIRILAADKAACKEHLIKLLAMTPPPPMMISKDDAERLGIKSAARPPEQPGASTGSSVDNAMRAAVHPSWCPCSQCRPPSPNDPPGTQRPPTT